MYLILFLVCVFYVNSVNADTVIYINTISYHENRQANYNEENYGIGFRYYKSENIFFSSGYYKNSEFNDSFYAGIGFESKDGYGVTAGYITGYNKSKIIPFVTPFIKYKNLILHIVPIEEKVIHLTIDVFEF